MGPMTHLREGPHAACDEGAHLEIDHWRMKTRYLQKQKHFPIFEEKSQPRFPKYILPFKQEYPSRLT